jgi:hypothetical protein
MAWVPPVRLSRPPKRSDSRFGLEDPPLRSELGTTSVGHCHYARAILAKGRPAPKIRIVGAKLVFAGKGAKRC